MDCHKRGKKMKKIVIALLLATVMLLTACQPGVHPVDEQKTAPAETTATPPVSSEPDSITSPEATTEPSDETSVPVDEVTTEPPTSDTEPSEPVTEPLRVDMDTFDGDLMNFVETKVDGNYMISPLSFQYALGMLMAGANGNTLKQFREGLGIDGNKFDDYIKGFNHFVEGFNSKIEHDAAEYDKLSANDKKYATKPVGVLRVADSVWKKSDMPDFLLEYGLKLEMYDAKHYSFTLDNVISEVNKWVNEQTEGMIPKLLEDNYDVSNLALILMNALYYKNSWLHSFTPTNLVTEFQSKDGAVKKDFISSCEDYRYYKDDKTELVIVEMANDVEMVIVIGDCSNLEENIKKAERKKVSVAIPKFEIETSLDDKELVEYLMRLGIVDAFGSNADFSAMFDSADACIHVDDIIQKTKIKLDETGVEAAVVTAITMTKGIGTLEDPIVFTADRPFHFFIRTGENQWGCESGITLFEGAFVK